MSLDNSLVTYEGGRDGLIRRHNWEGIPPTSIILMYYGGLITFSCIETVAVY
jgi:hypothetical protein